MIKLKIMFAASFVGLVVSQALNFNFSCPFYLNVGDRLSIFQVKW